MQLTAHTTCKLHNNTMNASGVNWCAAALHTAAWQGAQHTTLPTKLLLRHIQSLRGKQPCAGTALLPNLCSSPRPVPTHATHQATHLAGIDSLSLLLRHTHKQPDTHPHTLTHHTLAQHCPEGSNLLQGFEPHMLQKPWWLYCRPSGFINPWEVRGTLALHQG
jgi:hypothetical protein